MKQQTVLFLIFAFNIGIYQAQDEDDPCILAKVLFNEYRRSVNYTAGSEGEPESEWNNDRDLNDGWYIFDGPQGQEMPTNPPGMTKCGAKFPIWLNGQLPTIEEGEVERETCIVSYSENCYATYNIRIKKCENTYAYYLLGTNAEEEAYCVGSEVPCPSGESSETGFTPGCSAGGFPTLFNDPVITSDVYETPDDMYSPRLVNMLCDIEHNETDVFLDVTWYIGETKVFEQIGENAIAYNELPAQLLETDWKDKAHLDNNLRCEVRARFSKTDIPGNTVSSTYYMGFTLDSQFITVDEGGEPAYIIIRPTIPILCPVGEEDCQLYIEVLEPYIDDKVAACPDGRKLKQTAIKFEHTDCKMEINMTKYISPDTSFALEVNAATDGAYDGDHTLRLKLKTTVNHHYHPIWQDYQLPAVEVYVIDRDANIEGKKCYAHDDPHMLTFDGRMYDNHLSGEFIMYKHQHLPIEIQVYFIVPESKTYSKVCGAAIRSGGDLYIYDKCRNGEEGRQRLYECEDLDMSIKETDDVITIELPHGTVVKIDHNSITILSSLTDLENVEGLCGRFDLICGNDFYGGDGSEYPDPCAGIEEDCSNLEACNDNADVKLHDFSETWRVRTGDSLWDGHIKDYRPPPDTIYCSCHEKEVIGEDEPEYETICKRNKDLEFCIESDVTEGTEEACLSRRRARLANAGSDDVVDEVGEFPGDPDFVAPDPEWTDGWDEGKARASCENFLQNLQAIDTCLSIPSIGIESIIGTCVEDIKIMANEDFNIVHAGMLLSSCGTEIKKNMSFFNFDNDTGAVEPPNDMTGKICPSECNFRGNCSDGVCICNDGFFGQSCFYDENKVPDLYRIPNDGLCDVLTRPCEQTPVTGSYFLKKPTLSCHIEPVLLKLDGEKVPQGDVKIKARFDHMERVMCPLPVVTMNEDDDVFAVGYMIAVSNDGQTPSQRINLITYDPVCMNCTASDLNCFQVDNTCFVSDVCYEDQEKLQNKPCIACQGTSGELAQEDNTCFVSNVCYEDKEKLENQPCIACQGTSGELVQEDNTCFIDTSCYTPGQMSPTDPCLTCDPSLSASDWTTVLSDSCKPNNTGLIAGVTVGIIALVAVGSIVGAVFFKKKNKTKSRVHSLNNMEMVES